MTVPRLLVLTDAAQAAGAGHSLAHVVESTFRAGTPAVVLRERELPLPARRRLAFELAGIAAAHQGCLLVAGDAELAADVGAAGVHLSTSDPLPRPPGLLVGRSCHDRGEVAHASGEGVDYLTVSPAAETASKPGYGPALGPAGVARLVDAAGGHPVLALGGVTVANVAQWRAAGAHGVAVMGAVMRSPDPERATRDLMRQLEEESP